MSLTRRIVVLALAALGTGPRVEFGTPTGERMLSLSRLGIDPESAAVIGRLYRAAVPSESDPRTLAHLVSAALGMDISSAADMSQLQGRITRRVRADFSERRIANVGGWMLSQTEARLCALLA